MTLSVNPVTVNIYVATIVIILPIADYMYIIIITTVALQHCLVSSDTERCRMVDHL